MRDRGQRGVPATGPGVLAGRAPSLAGRGPRPPPPDERGEGVGGAGAAVFARQGYDGTKIMDVVRESGLSTGAVYGRFRSKNDLLREAWPTTYVVEKTVDVHLAGLRKQLGDSLRVTSLRGVGYRLETR